MFKAKLFSDDELLKQKLSDIFVFTDTDPEIFIYDGGLHDCEYPYSPSVLLTEDPTATDVSSFGYVIKKPFSTSALQKTVSLLLCSDEISVSPEEKAALLLDRLGASKKLKGYRLSALAVVCAAVCLRKGKAPVMAEIYSVISGKTGSSPASAERAIRTFAESVFRVGDINAVFDIFGNTPDPDKGKCTNAEFICRLAEKYNSIYKKADV